MTEPADRENCTAASDGVRRTPSADGIEARRATSKPLDWPSVLKRITCVVRQAAASFVVIWDTLVFRAWIAAVITAILAVLFLWSDQTSDLMLGIMYDIDLGQVGALSNEQLWTGVWRYLAFWIASVSLIGVLGLTARITGASRDWLPAVRPSIDEVIFRPVRLCAWVIVILSTGIMHLSALQALPRVRGEPYAVSIIVLACIGIRWAARKQFRRKTFLLGSFGIATAAFCAWVMFMEGTSQGWRLTFFVRWAEWITIAGIVLIALFAWTKQTVPRPGSLLGLLWIILVFIVYVWPVQLSQEIGSIATTIFHLSFITASAAGLVYAARRWTFVGKRPDLAIVLVLATVIWWSASREQLGQEQLPAHAAVASEVKQTSDLGTLAYAIYADGGGLRAALFTATILSLADDLTCGQFGTHVFAGSGVSGGALGIATWAMLRQELMSAQKSATLAWSDCKIANVPAQLARMLDQPPRGYFDLPVPLTNLVFGTLVRDHLAQPLAVMLTPDLTFSRKARRGQALVDSWQASALQTIRARLANRSSPEAYAVRLGALDAGLKDRPMLIFTATDADTGDRVVMSNIEWEPYAEFKNMSLGVAVLNSARFPIVSPSGAIETANGWVRVVDGGFYDNSGAASLREILVAAAAQKDKHIPPHLEVLRINGNPREESDARCVNLTKVLVDRGYVLVRTISGGTPNRSTEQDVPAAATVPSFTGLSSLSAFWNARSARAREAVRSLNSTESPGIVETVLDPFAEDPLPMFDSKCINVLPQATDADDAARQCIARDQAICFAAANARFGPLGWSVSNAAAQDIMWLAVQGLARSRFFRDQLKVSNDQQARAPHHD